MVFRFNFAIFYVCDNESTNSHLFEDMKSEAERVALEARTEQELRRQLEAELAADRTNQERLRQEEARRLEEMECCGRDTEPEIFAIADHGRIKAPVAGKKTRSRGEELRIASGDSCIVC